MFRLAAGFVLLVATAFAAAQDKKGTEPTLHTASGSVDKAGKDSLTIRPRRADGKFQKAFALKVTGTSKISVLTPQKRGDKVILTQPRCGRQGPGEGANGRRDLRRGRQGFSAALGRRPRRPGQVDRGVSRHRAPRDAPGMCPTIGGRGAPNEF